MSQEQFDDERLQNLARYTLYSCGNADVSSRGSVEKLLKKDKLENADRNVLLNFIDTNKLNRPKSMRQMKDEILKMIGQSTSDSYSNVPTSNEIRAIYDWFVENFKKGVK